MKHKVEHCSMCPMVCINEFYEAKCNHPEIPIGRGRFPYVSGIPDFCPLRDGAVVIRLKEKQ